MSSSKHPAIQMIAPERHAPKMQALPNVIIAHVATIQLQPFHGEQFNQTPAQQQHQFADAISAQTLAAISNHPPITSKPTSTVQPKSAPEGSPVGAEDAILGGIAATNTNVAWVINQSLGVHRRVG